MDPNAPLTTQQFTQALWALALGVAAPWLILLPARWAWERYQDRKTSREAQARLQAWEATHPYEPEDEHARLARIKDQLWLESLAPETRLFILRLRQEDAERSQQERRWHPRPQMSSGISAVWATASSPLRRSSVPIVVGRRALICDVSTICPWVRPPREHRRPQETP